MSDKPETLDEIAEALTAIVAVAMIAVPLPPDMPIKTPEEVAWHYINRILKAAGA